MKKTIKLFIILLSITACSLPGLGGDVRNDDIVIAGGNTTERQILSEIVGQMTEYYMPEVKTDLINNLGSTLLVLQTLTGGDTNVSGAMYTGTSLTGELGKDPIKNPNQALEEVVKGYYEKYNMIWFPSYGFENSYAFMVSRQFSEKYNVHKVSDLKTLSSELRAGVDTAWMDRKGDGYQDFKEIYQFDFKQVLPMEIGLVYDAVQVGEMDIVLGYSTDGRIDAYDLVVLEDDKMLFPPYDASPVVSIEALKKHPELENVLLRLDGAIDSHTMQALNRKSDEEKIEPHVVAKEFLEENKYFESVEVVSLKERSMYSKMMKEWGE